MSILSALGGTLLIICVLNTYAKSPEKIIYTNNPNFLGVWEEKNHSKGKVLKIQRVVVEDSKYNYVIKQKFEDPIFKVNIYRTEYVAFIQKNSLEALNRNGEKKTFYISKDDTLTDLNQYHMIRKKE